MESWSPPAGSQATRLLFFPHHRLGSGASLLPFCSPELGWGAAAHSGELLMTAIRRKAYDSFPLNCLLSL